jgi:DNA-binding transcriptional LysR family regulator
MDWLALDDFNLVARHGGFGRAARASGRPKATLSRRVAELEASLGLRLFERSARLRLTEEGRALHQRTGALLTEIEETAADIASGGERPRGRLRISAPLLFSQTAMGKLAAGFALAWPEVRLEVTTDDRQVDMVEEGYDLVIRVNPDPDASLVGRIFLRDRLVIVASPQLQRPAEGGGAVPVVVRSAPDRAPAWEMRTADGVARFAVDPVLSLSSMIMVRDAVRMGAGAGRLPVSLVGRDLDAGTLVHWGDVDGPEIALWTLYPSRRLLSARVSAFLAHLKAAFPKGTPDELAAYVAG